MRGSPREDESHGQRERSSDQNPRRKILDGFPGLKLRAVPPAPRAHPPTPLTGDSGSRGHATTRKLGFPLRSEETQTPRELHHFPRGGLEPPRGGWEGSLVTTHHSAPLLRPFPRVEPSEPVPAPESPRAETKVPGAPSRGERFGGATAGSDVTPFPVRRIMNDG